MAIERVIDTGLHEEDSEERAVEFSLRPTSFDEYIGQRRLKTNLKLAIDAAKKRGDVMDHVLLYGPPGLGKTTMAGVIAHEMGANFRATSAPSIEKAGDLASILTNLTDGDILFIDEIHRLRRAVEEILYSAMEDYKLDIVIGKGPAARSVKLDLPRFTLIGATTQAGNLAGPLRDRFGHSYRLEYYADNDIQQIIERSAKLLSALGLKFNIGEYYAIEKHMNRIKHTPTEGVYGIRDMIRHYLHQADHRDAGTFPKDFNSYTTIRSPMYIVDSYIYTTCKKGKEVLIDDLHNNHSEFYSAFYKLIP